MSKTFLLRMRLVYLKKKGTITVAIGGSKKHEMWPSGLLSCTLQVHHCWHTWKPESQEGSFILNDFLESLQK